MSAVTSKGTHYMVFPHTVAGLTRDDFNFTLVKDGEVRQDIHVELREISPNVYVASFVNDGTDYSSWTLIAQDPDVTAYIYIETWEVRKKIVEQNVKQIRSRQDSDGGFFKSSYEK